MDVTYSLAMGKCDRYELRLAAEYMACEQEVEDFYLSGAMSGDVQVIESSPMMKIQRIGMMYEMMPVRHWRLS